MNRPFYADALGFLGFPGKPIVVPAGLELDLVHMTAAPPWCRNMDETLAAIEKFKEQIAACPQLQIVTNGAEIQPVVDAGKTAVVLGLQHTPEDASFDWPKKLRAAGIRVLALAYQRKGRFGSGWANAELPLTLHGIDILNGMKDERLILDVSHAGHATAREALLYAKTFAIPVMASHGGCYRAFPHMRNLPDDVLRSVAELGGIVGIFTITFCLNAENNTLLPFVLHLRHAIGVCGESSVCVGGDGPYVAPITEATIHAEYDRLSGKLSSNVYNASFPDHPLECFAPNRMQVVETATETYGIQPGAIPGVLGKNLRLFFERALA